jgi:hypothetical protein
MMRASTPRALAIFSHMCADVPTTLHFRIRALQEHCYIIECVELCISVSQIARTETSVRDKSDVHLADVLSERIDFTAHAVYTVLAERIIQRTYNSVFIEQQSTHTSMTFDKLNKLFRISSPHIRFILQ